MLIHFWQKNKYRKRREFEKFTKIEQYYLRNWCYGIVLLINPLDVGRRISHGNAIGGAAGSVCEFNAIRWLMWKVWTLRIKVIGRIWNNEAQNTKYRLQLKTAQFWVTKCSNAQCTNWMSARKKKCYWN